MLNRILYTILFITCHTILFAQEMNVHGHFNADSVKLGEPIEYILSVKYPSKWQVLLPDSTYSFAPFEFQKKIFYPTKTNKGVSIDSVVYVLNTYEIESIQTLQLPAFVVLPNDCTSYQSNIDTVFFKHLVKSIPDSLRAEQLPLLTNTNYRAVKWLFNYPVFSIVAGVVLILLLLGWIFFGKKIRRHFILKRLNKNHLEFISSFDQAVEKLKNGFSPEHAETSVLIWKKYMESLLTRPYTKSTTRELRDMEKNEMLTASLRSIDRSIYGKIPPDSFEPFLNLKEFTKTQFTKKLEELKHG